MDDIGPRQLAGIRLFERLCASPDPVVALKARLLAGLVHDSAEAASLRARIADSAVARALLRVREQDERTLHHVYRKWQGPHWTLACLALIDYPPGDEGLRPLTDRVHDWLFSERFLNPPSTAVYEGQETRTRHCASIDGNAIWYSVRLNLEEHRTRALVNRLVAWQWPDGGWNCDKRLNAVNSSFQESLIPARGLWAYGLAHDYAPARDAAQRAAELMLARRLLWRRRDGSLIEPDWGGPVDRIHYPIQFYDVLFALQVMAELGRISDPRCADALDLLERKRLPDGGFPLEAPNAKTADRVASRASYADWGPYGLRHSNPLVSVACLSVLAAAGRISAR